MTNIKIFKRFESRGGKYSYVLFRDENGFTYKEYEGNRLVGGGGYGLKTEVEVLEHVTNYLKFFPSKMKEILTNP